VVGFQHGLDDLAAFLGGKGIELTGAAQGNQAVASGGDGGLDQLSQGL